MSILTIKNGYYEVISTAGDTHLGGEDFNNRMLDHLMKDFQQKYKEDISGNKNALRRLRKSCEEAKIALSSSTNAVIWVDALCKEIDYRTSITKAKFEQLCSDLFQSTLQPVEKAMSDAKMEKSQIDDIVLVGGSSRIPKIQELLSNFFNGKELNKSINPDEAVAYGATVQAALLQGVQHISLNDLVLVDITPLSLGIEAKVDGKEGVMSILIKRNTKIPTEKSGTYFTAFDNQTSIRFTIYEGEHPMAKDNNLLGQFILDGISPKPKRCS